MTTTLRAVMLGVLAGAALFFVPFLFRFLFIGLFIFFLIRLFTGYRWRRGLYGPGYWNDRYAESYHAETENELVSIDGSRYVSPVNRSGPENRYEVR
jgi:hypothetical protein